MTGRTAAWGAGILAAIVIVGIAAARERPVTIYEAGTVEMNAPAVFAVSRAADTGKPGALRGILGQARFHQNAMQSSPSADRLDFVFDAPAIVRGVWVSVDDRDVAMMEFAVGVNAPSYGYAARDWLLHVGSTGGDIDEGVQFDDGFAVGPGDRLSVAAWIFNDRAEPVWVSPEVVVWYEWLTRPS